MNNQLIQKSDNKFYIQDHQAYPIYEIQASWYESYDPKTYDPGRLSLDAPKGYFRNGTSYSRMLRDKAIDAYIWNETIQWFNTYSSTRKREKNVDIKLLKLSCNLSHYETWNLTWFSHETFDNGQTDKQALDSFEQYVSRYESLQNFYYDANFRPLMGAEDRWRWSGVDDSPPPCRCEHCKNAGMIRINH